MYNSVGYSSSNGKNALLNFFIKSFSIYTHSLDSKTFQKNYPKVHKQLLGSRNKRLCYINELDQQCLDTSLLKHGITEESYTCEIMHGSTETISITWNLWIISNHNFIVQNDLGFQRRGFSIIYKSQYLDQSEFKNEPGTFLRDYTLNAKVDTLPFQLAFTSLLLTRTQEFYRLRELDSSSSGMHIPDLYINNFKQTCRACDPILEVLDEYFIVTNNKKDKISQFDFKNTYNVHNQLKYSWAVILTDVLKQKLEYNDQIRCKRRNGNYSKGCIIGIRYKTQAEKTADQDD